MITRIKSILEHYNLSSSSFADKIDVPRSSISHLLSGRNKPSLDFIMKVDKAFDEIDLDWLLYGKGDFIKKESPQPTSLFNTIELEKNINKEENLKTEEKINVSVQNKKSLVKVILLYDNGTFDVFNQ